MHTVPILAPIVIISRLYKSRTQQLIYVSALRLRVILSFLQQHSQNLNRRVQAKTVCALPALNACVANAWLFGVSETRASDTCPLLVSLTPY